MAKKRSQNPTSKAVVLLAHQMDDGRVIEQRKTDGYFNATAMCQAAGKQFFDYARNATTVEYLDELASETGIPVSELIQSVRGGDPALQGTWVHPQVATHLAQWLSAKFAVWVNKWLAVWMEMLANGGIHVSLAQQQFYDRNDLTTDAVPMGYFCLYREMKEIIQYLISHNAEIGEDFVPDISGGNIWGKYWTDNNFDMRYGYRIKFLHNYPWYFSQARSNPQHPWCYPDEALAEFRRWMYGDYIPNNLPKYLKSKEKQGALPKKFTDKTIVDMKKYKKLKKS
jgi:hypothetical protein